MNEMLISREKLKVKRDKPLTSEEKSRTGELFVTVLKEMKKHGLPDVDTLRRAYNFALEAHGNTRRKNGDPYITHPLEVAKILAECGHETDMIVSAILHDVVEDCGISIQRLEKEFGVNVADTVNAVTKVSRMLAPDQEISTQDLDELSDKKFFAEIKEKNNRKAAYIKCADRIHNLRTISVFSGEKQRGKAYHTRTVIIPIARALHVHKLADILGNLCFEIENPETFQRVRERYRQILEQNRDTLYGKRGMLESVKKLIFDGGAQSENVVSFEFVERNEDNIFVELQEKMESADALETAFVKKNVPLYDVFFLTSDMCMEKPESVFFTYYEKLHNSKYRFTITGVECSKDEGGSYYKMEDRFGTRYRLYIQSETEHLEFTHGLLVTDVQDFRDGVLGEERGESAQSEQKIIQVFRKDGTAMMIEEGATALDFAFAIDRNIGICARDALINGKMVQDAFRRQLRAGDRIEVISDHWQDQPERDIPHATVRWFEFLHTKDAIRSLSRWLEKYMDSGTLVMVVRDGTGKAYEIDMGATVLDFAFEINEEMGLHLQRAYVNGCKSPTDLDKTLRYGDKVSFECDVDDKETPVLDWLSIVKTKKAKTCLLGYFDKKYHGNKD